jgi:hypothetical protein
MDDKTNSVCGTHGKEKKYIYSVLVGIAGEWRLLVRWRCNGKMMGKHGLDLCGEGWEHMTECGEHGYKSLVFMKFSYPLTR